MTAKAEQSLFENNSSFIIKTNKVTGSSMDEKDMRFGASPSNTLLIVISGPSGIGKDAVVGLLRKTNTDTHFVITMNSRPPRPDEVEGKDYFFVTREEFEAKIEAGELIEYAKVYSDYKGIPKSQVREAFASGKDVIMRLDVQGAMTIRNLCPQAILIFLTASSREEWINRLLERRSETFEEVELRLQVAAKEYELIDQFDYLVVNSDRHLDQTIADIQAIIRAEHLKTCPRKVEL